MRTGKAANEPSVVHRMHFDTIDADASNFSANITAFTAIGIDAKMKRTEKTIFIDYSRKTIEDEQ